MFCPSCGAKLKEQAKFCSSCGTNLQGIVINHADENVPAENSGSMNNPTTQVTDTVKNFKENEYVQQGAEISKQYFQFALSALKQPFYFAKKVNEKSFVNGLISIILFSLLFPLTSYFAVNNYSFYPVPFGETVITPAIVLFFTFFVIIGIMLMILKLMNVGANFKELVARVGSLLVFPVSLIVIAFVLTIIKATFLGTIFSGLALIFLQLTYFATMFSYEKKGKGGLDAYYGIILTIIANIIVFAIIFSVVFEALFYYLF